VCSRFSNGAQDLDPYTGNRNAGDTAEGCRALAADDRVRAEGSNNGRMRFRLACSAEAWNARADLLDGFEANRERIHAQTNNHSSFPEAQASRTRIPADEPQT
jgi:hypothetical protein